ncbi:MAG TPA: metal ABC transporter permease [Chthoniobacterales bacterium]|jgi:manganese transport system permease protein|nr:metal ABC transporter permease [Chthoniobacterales bacterium]
MNFDWFLRAVQEPQIQRALFGAVLIGFTNGILSVFIVIRRLSLMADAISHSLLPGLAIALILFGAAPSSLFVGAIVAAALVAFGTQIISNSSRIKEDTALGLLFACAFSLGQALLRFSPTHIAISDYLFGNILGLSDADLMLIYGVSCVLLPALVLLQRPFLLMLFEPSVAATQGVPVRTLKYVLMGILVLAMTSSLQAVGIILALGTLIAPAATIYLFVDSFPVLFWASGFLGAIGAGLGLLVSAVTDLPAGACIVLVLGLFFFIAYIFSPKYGILRKLTKGHLHEQSLARWRGSAS